MCIVRERACIGWRWGDVIYRIHRDYHEGRLLEHWKSCTLLLLWDVAACLSPYHMHTHLQVFTT